MSLAFIRSLEAIIDRLESDFGLTLIDEDFEFARDDFRDMLHVLLHEACHAVFYRIPWLKELHDQEHTLLDEVVVRILERDLSPEFGLAPHSIEEHLEELRHYDLSFDVTRQTFEHLAAVWVERYKPARDVAGFAEYARRYLLHR